MNRARLSWSTPRAPRVDASRLLSIARQTLPSASALLEARATSASYAYVAVDVASAVGATIAAVVGADHAGISLQESRRRVDETLVRRRTAGLSYVFTGVVPLETLLNCIPHVEARRALRAWFAEKIVPGSHRLVAVTGSRVTMELTLPQLPPAPPPSGGSRRTDAARSRSRAR